MIKMTLFVFLLIITCGSFSSETRDKPASASAIETEVRLAFEELIDAARNLNVDSYFKLIDEDRFVGLNSDGTVWKSSDELRLLIEPGFASIKEVTSLVFDTVEISEIDLQTAVLVNEFSQSVLLNTGEAVSFSGGGTQVWSKASGEWKIVSISASNKHH